MNLIGNPLDFLIVFFAGVLMSFTPCVYPLVPIVVGVVAGASRGSHFKSFILSLIYALGVAVVYALLGLIAALTGSIFGQFASSPWGYFIVANACILFGLALLDVFKLPIFSINTPGLKSRNIISIFALGMLSGLVASPCTSPMLGTILVYVGSKQNLFYGTVLLFCFACGVSTILVLAGTFSGMLANLPKPGAWMERVRKISGLILIAVGEYFLIQAGRYFL